MYDRDYELSYVGPTTIIAFNGSAGVAVRIRLGSPGASGGFKKKSFAVRVTQAARYLQGAASVATTGSAGTDPGMQLPTTARWRLDIDDSDNAFISIIGDTTTGGNIELTKITETTTDDPPVLV